MQKLNCSFSEQNNFQTSMPVLSDPPEFKMISRAAASIMMHASPSDALGHVLFLVKNHHAKVQIKSDRIQPGDIISFDFVYESQSWTDNKPTTTVLETRHPDLMTKCPCSESQGFLSINGEHGYQRETFKFFIFMIIFSEEEYYGNGEKFVLNNPLFNENTLELKLSFKHNTACFKPFIIDKMSNKCVSPVITMLIKIHDENMNQK